MFGSKKSIALALVSALLLSGCGAPAVGMLNPSAVRTNKVAPVQQAPAPTVSVIRGQAPAAAPIQLERQHEVPGPVSTLRILGSADMSEDEIAEDLELSNMSILAADGYLGQKISKTGLVRKTADGYAFEVTSGVFKKTTSVYALSAKGDDLTKIADRVNKKALIKGTFDEDQVLTVTAVKSWLNLSAMFNVFTKGRVVGVVTGADGKALADVKVTVESKDGFIFSELSDAEGEFAIKGLSAGDYKVTLAKAGFQAIQSRTVSVAKRKAVKLEGSLAPTAVAAE